MSGVGRESERIVFFVSGPPTLPQLLHLKIPQRVGDNNYTFGILLLNDVVSSRVPALKMECQGNTYSTVVQTLQEWLEGRGLEPVTWETLIKTLRESGLSALADEVQQKLLLSPLPQHPWLLSFFFPSSSLLPPLSTNYITHHIISSLTLLSSSDILYVLLLHNLHQHWLW